MSTLHEPQIGALKLRLLARVVHGMDAGELIKFDFLHDVRTGGSLGLVPNYFLLSANNQRLCLAGVCYCLHGGCSRRDSAALVRRHGGAEGSGE